MVLRNRRINTNSDVIQLHVSFSLTDVRQMFKEYASHFADWAREAQHTESDVCYWLEHSPAAFNNYPLKWRDQLSRWAFAVAVRNRLLLPCATKENTYFLTDVLFAKRGRPRKQEG